MATSQTDFLPLAVFPPAVARLDRRDIANRWSGAACLLNGELAQIVGRRLDFAIVRTLDPHGPSHEWSWETVEHVMTRLEGKFRT
jgi:hypothetical protein